MFPGVALVTGAGGTGKHSDLGTLNIILTYFKELALRLPKHLLQLDVEESRLQTSMKALCGKRQMPFFQITPKQGF
jgi:hypothetical protein